MKERPMKEFEYFMAPLVKCAREDKERKKAVRKENIKKGSKFIKRPYVLGIPF